MLERGVNEPTPMLKAPSNELEVNDLDAVYGGEGGAFLNGLC